jgi:putative flippase GtrA
LLCASAASKTSTRGRKRRFGVAGIINVAITNLILQLLLASNLLSVLLATLISQGVNTTLGYLIYGKLVFKAEGLRHHRPVLKYLSVMTGIWLLNSGLIEAGESAGISRNLSAAALIPALAMLSYAAQKNWVFRQ